MNIILVWKQLMSVINTVQVECPYFSGFSTMLEYNSAWLIRAQA